MPESRQSPQGVLNGFFVIWDLAYLKAGIQDYVGEFRSIDHERENEIWRWKWDARTLALKSQDLEHPGTRKSRLLGAIR